MAEVANYCKFIVEHCSVLSWTLFVYVYLGCLEGGQTTNLVFIQPSVTITEATNVSIDQFIFDPDISCQDTVFRDVVSYVVWFFFFLPLERTS